MTATEIKEALQLHPHPREGGWYVRTYEANERIVCAERYGAARLTSTAIYYLLEPDTSSEMHRLRSDEIFHFYLGDPVEMLQLHEDGRSERIVIGSDLVTGARQQVLVPRGVWQGTRLLPGGRFALMGCTVSPGFEYLDYESGSRAELLALWPEWSEMIAELTK